MVRTWAGVGTLGKRVRRRLEAEEWEDPLRAPSAEDPLPGPLAVELARSFEARSLGRVVVVALPWERLLGSIVDRGRGPCMLLSHHGRLIFHSGYTRKLQVGWGDNSIVPVLARELGRRG